jgi:hypothetical protein
MNGPRAQELLPESCGGNLLAHAVSSLQWLAASKECEKRDHREV